MCCGIGSAHSGRLAAVMDEPTPISIAELDAIIFDLGGVLLQLNYRATVHELSTLFEQDVAGLYAQAKQDAVFDAFERGEIDPSTFHQRLIGLLPERSAEFLEQLAKTNLAAAVDTAWNKMLLNIPGENLELLSKLKGKLRVYLLSNTNQIHLERFLDDYAKEHLLQHGPWQDHFHATYYSHLLGQRKPEARIYQRVLAEQGLDPGRTLFIDDNHENLAGARAVGIKTIHHPTNAALAGRFM